MSEKYNTVTIQAAEGGWLVSAKGTQPRVFVRWDALVRYLETLLTSKGDATG